MDFNLGSFQDTSFARQVQYSKPTVGGMLWISGSQAFVPFSSMCKKQTAVSHSSAESEIISLDTGLNTSIAMWDLCLRTFSHSDAN